MQTVRAKILYIDWIVHIFVLTVRISRSSRDDLASYVPKYTTCILLLQIRATKIVSIWPVAFAAKLYYEGPLCVQGGVTAWHTGYAKDRDFPIDMAGFAVNLKLILEHSGAQFRQSRSGWLETDFLHELGVTAEDLECRDGGVKEVVYMYCNMMQGGTPIPSPAMFLHSPMSE